MNKVKIILIASLFLLAACGSGSGDSSPSSTAEGESIEDAGGIAADTAAEASDIVGLCANAYYPVAEGVQHSYVGTGGPSGDFTFTTTITDIREDGFTLVTIFDDLTLTQQWACLAEGLVPLEYSGGPAAQISVEGGEANFETTAVTGLFLPASIEVGDTWTQSFEISGQQEVPGAGTALTSGDALYEFEALGFESVSTAAGDFVALAISTNITVELTVQIEDVALPSSFTTTGISYFVEGNGWVKSAETADFFGIISEHMTDLTSFSIP